MRSFAEANRFGADYRIRVASVDGRDVTTSFGTRLGVTDAIASIESADTVLVAGSDELPRRAIDPELVEAVRSLSARTRRMASICTGSFVLAQAGLLHGRRATTHWHDARLFARAFPDVTVEPDAIFVRDGNVFTSAGISSGIDLALALVEMDHGTDLVREVARWLVVYLKRAGGQSQFSVLVETDPPPTSPLRAVTDAIAADPAANHNVKTLAAQASLSTRQLTRLFQAELGTTPARYVEMVRIDVARAALMPAARSPTPHASRGSAAPKVCAGCSPGSWASRRRLTGRGSARHRVAEGAQNASICGVSPYI